MAEKPTLGDTGLPTGPVPDNLALYMKDVDSLKTIEPDVARNLFHIVGLAIKYSKRIIHDSRSHILDLIQVANEVYPEAVEKYDSSKGKFSTYLDLRARQAMGRYISEMQYTISVPEYIQTVRHKILRAQEEFLQKNGRESTEEELIETLSISPKRIESALQIAEVARSLDEQFDEAESRNHVLFFQPQSADSTEDEAVHKLSPGEILVKMERLLPPELALPTALRYGLATGDEFSTEFIGRILGITDQTVRKRVQKAFAILRADPFFQAMFK